MSFLTALFCPRCEQRVRADSVRNLCEECGSPLLAEYHLHDVARELKKEHLASRQPSMWRYGELLPLQDQQYKVTLGEGWTPIVPLAKLGRQLGLPHLFMKDEGRNPTGTFKDRGASVGVSRALELGVRHVAMPTAGNAGGAWAAYCARAGIELDVVMPEDTPEMNKLEAHAYGARVHLVRGLISDAGRIVARAVERHGWFDASTLKEPYRIEGKKTLGLEIAEQFGWDLPDAILYPAGGGVGLIGMWKAFNELETMRWTGTRRPKLIVVQPEGCAPLVRAFQEGAKESRFWDGAHTVASGLRVPKALGDFLVLQAIRETGGYAAAVPDAAILDAIKVVARAEGAFICPEGAAMVAALPGLVSAGVLSPDERVVLVNTGSGLKYPGTVTASFPVLEVDGEIGD